MKTRANSESKGSVFFLDFIFNPLLRTFKRNNTVIRLRKKQSDVFELLCVKYPNPVSQDEFLTEVWGGGYVTSQSIAQVIRSLRVSLGDESKSVIVTIPKLGYQLAVEPRWVTVLDEPESLNEKKGFKDFPIKKTEVSNEFFTTTPVIDLKSQEIPYVTPCTIPSDKVFNPGVLVFSAVIVMAFVFANAKMSERNSNLNAYQYNRVFSRPESGGGIPKPRFDILSSCLTVERIIYYPKQENLLFFKPFGPAEQDDKQSF